MRIAFLLALLLLASTAPSTAHDHGPDHAAMMHAPPPRFELPEGAQEITIPFQQVNHHLLLQVKVNGVGPFQVILDTGMGTEGLILYDSERVKALKLPYLDDVTARVGGAGGKGKPMDARLTSGIGLEIGGLKVLDARGTVVSMNRPFGGYHEGIIGAILFRHFAVSIDNDHSLLTLRRPEDYAPPEGAGALPLVFDDGGKPFAEARVRIADGEAKPVRLAVDLGASHVVSLNETRDNGILAPAGSIAATIGRGMSGEVLGRVGRIASLELGPFKLANLVATFPDKAYQNPRGMDSKDGNLGNGALSRFLVTFDYAHERLVLLPAAGFSEPSEWDMSGMQGELTPKGTVEVSRVLAGSPAEAAGIREGDTLVRIAGEEVTQTSYFTLKDRFKKDGETVRVELRRKDKPVTASLKLRRLV